MEDLSYKNKMTNYLSLSYIEPVIIRLGKSKRIVRLGTNSFIFFPPKIIVALIKAEFVA